MNRTLFPVLCTAIAFFCSSCQKDEIGNSVKDEIILTLADGSIDMSVATKATEITALPSSLNLARTTGTWKNETTANASSSFAVSSSKIATGWYQTATPTAYNYYVSNVALTFAAGGSTISASNETDVIAGCTQGANNTANPSVTLDHIFARTDELTCNTQEGYSISDVSWKIQSKSGGTGGTKGTYNVATKAWSGVTALSSTAITKTSDMYLVPGVYTVSVTYTLKKGDYSQSFTKSGDVTLVAGKKNSITCTAKGGSAAGIELSVTLTAWGTESHTLSFS